MTFFALRNPWKPFALLALALGVCLFMSPSGRAWAIDDNSQLFQQSQGTDGQVKAASQPLALPEEKPSSSPGVLSTLLSLFWALLLTVGLIILTVWGLKFVWEKKAWSNLGEENKPIRVLTSTFLGPRKAIHLVEVGKRVLVVGVGSDEINCLDVISDPEEIASLKNVSQPGFSKIFNKALGGQEAKDTEEETRRIVQESSEVVGGYVEKLKKITRKKNEGLNSPEKKS